MSATLHKADGTSEDIVPDNGTDFQLVELQALVGGVIEIHTLPSGEFIVMHEEGTLQELPVNNYATVVAYHLDSGSGIRGDVVVCDQSMIQ